MFNQIFKKIVCYTLDFWNTTLQTNVKYNATCHRVNRSHTLKVLIFRRYFSNRCLCQQFHYFSKSFFLFFQTVIPGPKKKQSSNKPENRLTCKFTWELPAIFVSVCACFFFFVALTLRKHWNNNSCLLSHLHTCTLAHCSHNTTIQQLPQKELNDFSLFLLLLPVFPTSFPTTFVYLLNLLGELLPNVENEHLKTFRWLSARWRTLLPV